MAQMRHVLARRFRALAQIMGARPNEAGDRGPGQPPVAGGNYRAYAGAGVAALQRWYNRTSGLWDTTNWWNAANALYVVIDHARRTGTTYSDVIANTFARNAGGRFLNKYYDDEGWWALTWIAAYDLTQEQRYLDMAKAIFADMQTGWDLTCGGGIWWSKERTYKNAIANELFFAVAIRLHQRTPGDSGPGSYLDWAQRAWAWFRASGMINAANLVNDGLRSCRNNGGTTWTYNQGVILGGLADLYLVTGDSASLAQAEAIADAAIATLVNADGILKEPSEPASNADNPQFKGIFMRNLAYLYEADQKPAYRDFIVRNAEAIWRNNRNPANQFGLMWYGPFDRADAARQSAALDAIDAAIPFNAA
jgi:predicted alpha-1,6-mannanase (GH76 family)